MVEITLPIVLQIIQTISLAVGIFYYLTIMRNQQRSNNLYTLQQRVQTMDRSHWQAWANVLQIKYETTDEWVEKYNVNANPEVFADWCYIGSLYHNVGFLLKHNLVDPDTVFELYPPGSILRVWRRYETVVDRTNEVIGGNLWQYFKYLKGEAERKFPELELPDDY